MAMTMLLGEKSNDFFQIANARFQLTNPFAVAFDLPRHPKECNRPVSD